MQVQLSNKRVIMQSDSKKAIDFDEMTGVTEIACNLVRYWRPG